MMSEGDDVSPLKRKRRKALKQDIIKRSFFAMAGAIAFSATAADYFVSPDGSNANAGTSAGAPFATIDKAVSSAHANDIIHVAPGDYSTTAQWGPNLTARLVGEGSSRSDVVIRSSGTYRTLRMAAGSRVENVTIIGEGTGKADKGGAIEMYGGVLTNCTISGGYAVNGSNGPEGGNLYVAGSSLVVDCAISGGKASRRGGNVFLDGGTVRGCTISDGVITSNNGRGSNVHVNGNALLSGCRLAGGTNSASYNGGSLCMYNTSAVVENCLVTSSGCGGVLLERTANVYNCTIVANEKYGVWAWSASQHVFNTVVYGNKNGSNVAEWNGDMPSGSSYDFRNCALSSNNGRFAAGSYPGLALISSSYAFVDYTHGVYSPSSNGSLEDAGTPDPRGDAASPSDIAGNARVCGNIDIGCYERGKPEFAVHIDGTVYGGSYAPASVAFSHYAENSASPEKVRFTYNFGDGSATSTTGEGTISHSYATPGVYTVRVTATNPCEDDEEDVEVVYADLVRVGSQTIYVNPNSGGGSFPYNTPQSGYSSLKTAVEDAVDGQQLLLASGVHYTADQIPVAKALTIRGLGATPEAVIIRNTTTTPDSYYYRTMEVDNAGARIENVTLENGCVKNQFGGNLRLVQGVVSNCVIRGGRAVVNNGNAGGGGVELAGAATLTHCVVSNNLVQGTSNGGAYAGGAVAVQYNAKNGRISNCLIVRNTYTTSGGVKAGAAGIRFCGSNDNTQIENNTIAGNVVEGSLSDDSAGVHCTTWYGRLRNNIILGNYETGKQRYTSIKMDYAHGTYITNLTDDESTPTQVFRNFNADDFDIKAGSLAYNTGTLSGLVLTPSVDIAGNPRCMFNAIDVGCYESSRRAGSVLAFR